MKKRYLILQDGAVFEGYAFGADVQGTGELVFTTGMAGYIETLTDPSYFGQIVLQTFPLIGNYGIIPQDFEGKCCVKGYVVRELQKRGCEVSVLPADTSAEELLGGGYDGVMLSNGPGDPQDNAYQIEQIAKIKGKLPIFGICLGHQLLALASGARTVKLKYGHRGVNQPVRDVLGTRTFITSQNHGYAVDVNSVSDGVVSFINANDMTCEGINYPDKLAFSVQFHPEACSGPKDTAFLFDKFIGLMEENANASR